MKRARLVRFLLLSLLLHLVLIFNLRYAPLPGAKKGDQGRVRFLELPAPALPPGQVVELPRPKKLEQPRQRGRLSEFSSRAHGPRRQGADERGGLDTPRVARRAEPPALGRGQTSREGEATASAPQAGVGGGGGGGPMVGPGAGGTLGLPSDPERGRRIAEALRRPGSGAGPGGGAGGALSGLPLGQGRLPLLSGPELERYARLPSPGSGPGDKEETLSLDSQEFKYASYFRLLKEKIELMWSYPEPAAQAGIDGNLLLRFTIRNSGVVEEIKLLRSSGYRILDDEAINAVKGASPFPSFPPRFDREKLNITASFTYIIENKYTFRTVR